MSKYSKLFAALVGVIPIALATFGIADETGKMVMSVISMVGAPILVWAFPANA